MSVASPELDEAYDRMAASGFELPNGFVNHGPMACEALDALGLTDDIDEWARRFASSGGCEWSHEHQPASNGGTSWAITTASRNGSGTSSGRSMTKVGPRSSKCGCRA